MEQGIIFGSPEEQKGTGIFPSDDETTRRRKGLVTKRRGGESHSQPRTCRYRTAEEGAATKRIDRLLLYCSAVGSLPFRPPHYVTQTKENEGRALFELTHSTLSPNEEREVCEKGICVPVTPAFRTPILRNE